MSLFSIAVLVLLFVRHRGNIARIWAGTERRVNFRRARSGAGRPAAAERQDRGLLVAGLVVLCWPRSPESGSTGS